MRTIKERLYDISIWLMLPFLGLLLVICIGGTHHNIVWYKELLVTLVFVGCIMVISSLILRGKSFLEKHEKKLLVVFLLLMGISLYAVSCLCRNIPMYDYSDLYNSAYSYATGGPANWDYLSHWKNNFPLFFCLYGVMKLAVGIGIKDPFYILLLINVLLTVWAGYCIYRLVRLCTGSVAWSFIGMGLFFGFIPLWCGTNYFYTDSLSLSFGVAAVWILLRKKQGIKDGIIAGLLWGMGYALKATVAISLVAVFIVIWLKEKANRQLLLKLSISVFAFGACLLLWTVIRMQYPCYEMEKENRVPITYWLALGIHNDGSYPQNKDFAVECLGSVGVTAKEQVAKDYISTHISGLWDWNHFVEKARYNFASGKMGSSEFNQYPVTPMYELINDYGKYGGYSTMFLSAYFYAILLLGWSGFVVAYVKDKGKKQRKPIVTLFYTTQLTLFGFFLFLTIWESNNRQLYNHIPWYAIYGAMGLYYLLQVLKKEESEGESVC